MQHYARKSSYFKMATMFKKYDVVMFGFVIVVVVGFASIRGWLVKLLYVSIDLMLWSSSQGAFPQEIKTQNDTDLECLCCKSSVHLREPTRPSRVAQSALFVYLFISLLIFCWNCNCCSFCVMFCFKFKDAELNITLMYSLVSFHFIQCTILIPHTVLSGTVYQPDTL